jgi:hypothetical protein
MKMKMKMKTIFGLGLLALARLAGAQEAAATPYRPTLSNPAELSAPGWLEVEMGVARSKGGENRWQNNRPYTLKYAFSEDFGVMLSGDLHVRQVDLTGEKTAGQGDRTLVFKQRFGASEDQAFGLEWGAKLATAASGIGSGKADYVVNGIYSIDVAAVRIDANLGATRLGLQEKGLGRSQYNWSAAVSKEVMPKWTVAGELSGTARQGKNGASQFLAAASYAVNKQLVLDAGTAAGISRMAPDWSVFAGLTWLVKAL